MRCTYATGERSSTQMVLHRILRMNWRTSQKLSRRPKPIFPKTSTQPRVKKSCTSGTVYAVLCAFNRNSFSPIVQ
jgi:hypothetical protein